MWENVCGCVCSCDCVGMSGHEWVNGCGCVRLCVNVCECV